MTNFSDLKITKQFAFFLLLFSFVPLFCLATFWFYQWHSTNEDIQADLIYLTYLNKNRVVQITNDYKNNLTNLRDSTEWQAALSGYLALPISETYNSVVKTLEEKAIYTNSFSGLSVLEKSGTVIFSTNEDLLGKKYQEFDWFFNTLEVPKILFINPGTDQVAAVLCSVFVLPDGSNGFLAVDLNLGPLLTLKDNYETINKTGEFQLVVRDRLGNAQILFTPRFPVNQNRLLFFPEQIDSLYIKALTEDGSFSANFEDYREVKVMAATKHLLEYDWGLVVKIDSSEALSPLRALAKSFGLVFFFLLAFGLVLTFYFYLYVTKPLAILSNNAEEVRKGRLKSFQSLKTKNEVGLLSQSFSELTQTLLSLNASLEQKVAERTAALKKQFDEMKRDKAKDDALISSLGDSLIVVTPRGVVARINRVTEEIFGVKEKTVVGDSLVSIFKLMNSDGVELAEAENPVFQSLNTGQKVAIADLFSKRANGSLFPVALTAAPIVLGSRTIGAVVIVRDITHEKEVDRLKSEFISIASHQLRGPVASIKWYGELLFKESFKFSKATQEFVSRINFSTKQLISLIDGFLNVSRIETGRLAREPKLFVPADLIGNIIEIYHHESAQKKLKIKFENQVGQQEVFLDPEIVREIYDNLIANAVKYSKENGDIFIRLFKENVALILEVKDCGEGIPANEQNKVFGKFFRANNVLVGGYKGTGLGLYSAKILAEQFGGKIWFISKEGAGSTFSVSLPIKKDLKPEK